MALWTEGACPLHYRRKCPFYKALEEDSLSVGNYLEVMRVVAERCHGESGGCLRRRQFDKEEGLTDEFSLERVLTRVP